MSDQGCTIPENRRPAGALLTLPAGLTSRKGEAVRNSTGVAEVPVSYAEVTKSHLPGDILLTGGYGRSHAEHTEAGGSPRAMRPQIDGQLKLRIRQHHLSRSVLRA